MAGTNDRQKQAEDIKTVRKANWHDAFYIAVKAELIDYKDVLEFIQEQKLNTEPLRIDVLVIKKEPGVIITKHIAEDFRSHNIFEYKSPSATLGIYSYLKTIGYAGIYQSIKHVPERDMTLTLVSQKHPRNLIKYLTRNGREVKEAYPGIYKVKGEHFPVQLLESKELSEEDGIWLRSLRRGLKADEIDRLAERARVAKQSMDISAYMDVFFNANKELMAQEGENYMKSLEKWQREMGFIDKWIAEGKVEGKAEGEARGKAEGEAKGINNMFYVMRGLKNNIPPEQLSEEAGLPIERVLEMQGLLLV